MLEVRKQTYTIEEIAVILGLGKTLTYRMVNNGEIPAIKCGKRWVIPCERFDRWFNDKERMN